MSSQEVSRQDTDERQEPLSGTPRRPAQAGPPAVPALAIEPPAAVPATAAVPPAQAGPPATALLPAAAGPATAARPAPAAGPPPLSAAARPGVAAQAGQAAAAAFAAFTGRPMARYQAAVVRIGFALVVLVQLLREWPGSRELYGDRSPWSLDMARRLAQQTHAFSVLEWQDGCWWFEACYALTVLAAVLMLLGWRTRFSSVAFLVGVLSVQNRGVLVGDGGDNLVHLMAIYLAFTRCAEVWSLDARRRDRGAAPGVGGVLLWGVAAGLLGWAQLTGRISWASAGGWSGPGWAALFWTLWAVAGLWWVVNRRWPAGEGRAVLDALGSMVHHCALFMVGAQVVLVYATAGLYKVQGPRWQDGTALYYPLHLDYFTPWPGLSALLGSSALLVFAFSYGTVLLQVAFPFTLVNRRLKNVLLAVMVLEHLGIAVLLGLPVFSLAMIAADAVFLPTGLLLWLDRRAGEWRPGRRPRPA
ncbi:HTTM domain-containing protein [Kitasatospora sp. RB6PN24]|uniref:HTTM domain-containing protein n=1 Tax=Kitasatospora humi TaxID=2893891 RepID=UPI001E2E8090|nr:HTTM domain-containing protein [Kitasatospora humi]MCC9307994.1 HTTM domain-containing protein [Kitasatospora humi]